MNKISRRNFLKLSAATAAALAAQRGIQLPKSAQAQVEFQGTLEMWDWTFDARNNYMLELIEAWQGNNPGAEIEYTTFGWSDLSTKLLTSVEAGSNPPLSNVHNEWRPALQKANRLVPYPEDIYDFDQLVSSPFLRDPETGGIYTCVFGYYCDQVFVNLEMLEEEGLTIDDVPRKWEDFFAFAQQLTRLDSRGYVERPGMALNHYWSQQWLWQSLVYQQGAYLYNEDGTAALWNSDAGVTALQMIKDWFNEYKLDDPNLDRSFDMFQNELAAGYISQGYTAGDHESSSVAGKWATAPTPTFTGEAEPAWGMVSPEEGVTVFANHSEEAQAAAFDFIQHMIASKENRIAWSKIMQAPGDHKDILDAPEVLENDTGRVIETQGMTLPYRVIIGEQPLEAVNFWRTMFEKVILNNEDAKAAVDEATEGMNQVFKDNPDTRYLLTERAYKMP